MRLFAVDMDGTCLNSKQQITDRTLMALRRAAEAGIEIVPTTGRTRTCLPSQLQNERYIRYIITSNGARVTDLQTGKQLYTASIPDADALSLLAECRGQKLGITAHIDDEYIVQGRLLYWLGHAMYGRDASRSICVKNICSYISGKHVTFDELQFFFLKSDAKEQAKEILSRYALTATYSDKYVEVFSKEANKGIALSVLARHLSIPQKQIACIGDGENDLFMFQVSGLKLAMGNAVDKLKIYADCTVSSNDCDGVAEAIERYLL